MNEINIKLKKLRKINRYTQEDLAKKLGISVRAYSKLENGETQLTIERLRKIIDIFQSSFSFFFDDNNTTELCTTTNNDRQQDTIPLISHYEETIVLLQEHIQTLKTLLEKEKCNL